MRPSGTAARVRPMHADDFPDAAALSAAAFDVDLTDPDDDARWTARTRFALDTDPAGAFVAERGGDLVGVSQAIRRGDRLWVLSLLTVRPAAQGAGAGRLLLDAALTYAAPGDAGLIVSSSDPRALALYAGAGFALHPAFDATGTVATPAHARADPEIESLPLSELSRFDGLSATVRGAGYTDEAGYLRQIGAAAVCLPGRGYVIYTGRLGVFSLVAADDDAAARLLRHALRSLATAPEPPSRPVVRWITGSAQWAIRAALDAGLSLTPHGALAVRGEPGTLAPFLPSGMVA